jgi:tRNA(Ile)-lysidine synthase
VSAADEAVSAAEAKSLLDPLARVPALVLAVSGGPDSTALLFLVARWRNALKAGPALTAITVDHGLRAASAGEARTVKRLASELGVAHRTLRWRGAKPTTALQEAARAMRYRLLAVAAIEAKAKHILTAHTLDDQAETVLFRMSRGSGLTGLAAMARVSPLPACDARSLTLVRPLLDVPKARLIATLQQAGIDFVRDPSNHDPRFTRVRMREVMPGLAQEGLDAYRLALLAQRLRRADQAIEAAVDEAARAVSLRPWTLRQPISLDAGKFATLPAEVALRLLGRAIARAGDGGRLELAKLEALHGALDDALGDAVGDANRRDNGTVRRTLGGALVTARHGALTIEPAPPRRRGRRALTTDDFGGRKPRNGGRMQRPDRRK